MGTVQLKHGTSAPLLMGGAPAIDAACCCAYCNLVSSVSLTIAGMGRDADVIEPCDCAELDGQCATMNGTWFLTGFAFGGLTPCYDFSNPPPSGGNCVFAYPVDNPSQIGRGCAAATDEEFAYNAIIARVTELGGLYRWDAWVGVTSAHEPPDLFTCQGCAHWTLGGLSSPSGTFTLGSFESSIDNSVVCTFPATVSLTAAL